MDLLLHSTPTAQFHALISTAQSQAEVHLPPELESYLVFLLMRFSARPELAGQVLGLRFLEALEESTEQATCLREVGDHCLLFAGLFPEHAQRKHVTVRYFVHMGQSAYGYAAGITPKQEGQLLHHLSTQFIPMTGVLQATRQQSTQPTIEAWLYSLAHSPTTH